MAVGTDSRACYGCFEKEGLPAGGHADVADVFHWVMVPHPAAPFPLGPGEASPGVEPCLVEGQLALAEVGEAGVASVEGQEGGM